MSILILSLTVLCMIMMFFVQRIYKIAILFVSLMLFSLVTLPIGGIKANSAISLCFLLSEFKYIKPHFRRVWHSVMIWFVGAGLLTFLISVAFSHNLRDIFSIAAFAQSELLVKLCAMIFSFVSLRRTKSLKPTLQFTFYALLVMTAVAVLNYITKSSFFVQALSDEFLDGFDFVTSKRFRVQATFINPFDYGYICVLLSLLHLYGLKTGQEQFSFFLVAELCCLFGVFTCGCRTILLCFALCIVIFFVCTRKKLTDKFVIILTMGLIALVAFFFVPSVRNGLLGIFSIFDPDADVEGSSLMGRMVQLGAVFTHLQGNWFFGRGINYFYIDLGWSEGISHSVDTDLLGLEGIYLNLLLERGIVGFAIYIVMMAMLVVFIIRNRRYGRYLYALGLSTWILYVFFCFMTGELASTPPAYLVLGYIMSVTYTRKSIVKRMAYDKQKSCDCNTCVQD